MAISQTASRGSDKMNANVASGLNNRDNLKGSKKNSESTASKMNKAEKPGQNSNEQVVSEKKSPGKESLKINDYLKMISKFESGLKQEKLDEKDLTKFLDSLEEKIMSLTAKKKTRLKSMEFFKKHGITSTKKLKETLVEMFKGIEERGLLFDFLKNPEFLSIMMNESDTPGVYSLPGTQNSSKPLKT